MTISSEHITLSLDLSGLKCPLPVLKARRAIKDMSAGEVLKVVATDPAAQLDFPHFCETAGHELISITSSDSQHEDNYSLEILIRVAE